MKACISRPLSILSFAAALAIGASAASAQTAAQAAAGQAPAEGGMAMGMHDHAGMMGGGDMKEMMSKMHDMMDMMAAHVDDRLAALKTELNITEAQAPHWNSFAEALRSAAKSAASMRHEMMQARAAGRSQAAWSGDKAYPDMGAIKKTAAGPAPESVGGGLPAKLEMHEKMAAEHLARLQAIKAALDPLYASFSDEQKKLADGLMIGPMGVM